uniref:ERAP1-like C-terminal domain-containing protein n=1 Tax=Timema shepardi TaxID=629360 RepID=A0A7R9G4G7_TIMSH|nr:unnamed protein product [Timema shepardi]
MRYCDSVVWSLGMFSTSGEDIWDKMWQMYVNETDAQERTKLLYGLASVPEPWLLHRYIEYAKDESNVRSQDFFTVLHFIASNPVGNPIVWDFIRSEWEYLTGRFTLNNRYLGRTIPHVCSSFANKFKLQEMETFFSLYPEAGAGTTARKQALEKVANNIKWLEKHRTTIDTWLTDATQGVV